ncbi:hypothetical protein [Vibrio genomosp. F10]|uniref:hypothetical protein n=1 Tax=Vibrio genomosp. F10 TaxID=723171 RepID=UPI00114C89F9|nr:hypothetical protein [Vibrio genomosp. F10]
MTTAFSHSLNEFQIPCLESRVYHCQSLPDTGHWFFTCILAEPFGQHLLGIDTALAASQVE